jgi:nitrogenase-stabilizing/protective protein
MTVLDQLRSLSAAEDFFRALEVPYDAAVLNVARLHILKRMGQYLRQDEVDEENEEIARAQCRQHLEQAYQDFVRSSPLEERVFKVHQDAIGVSPLVQISAGAAQGEG